MEVYGRKKRGVAYNHQGQRVGRPHVASWAEAEIVLAADLGDGTDDPRATAPGLLRRALASLPERARASGRVAMRADAGYFAGQLARAAHDEKISFAIGAKRVAPLWRLLAGIDEDAWHDATGMDNAQVAVAEYCPDWWPASTRLLVRRVLLDPAQVSADPRSRRRRTLHPDQRALPFPELARAGAIYAYSFIMTNLDVSAPGKAVAAEHWYRHRTTVENIFRDSKLGAALRHLPSGYPQVNLAWMWGALLAATMAAWLHQLTAVTAGQDIVCGHGVRGRKAMIATLRWRLIAVPGRLTRHARHLTLRLPPGHGLVVPEQHIDTTTSTGRLVFHILGAIDEFQRELIIEGTREGLQAGWAHGRTGGRKPKLNARQAGTSSSTRRPRSSSPPLSRQRSNPVRLPGRRAEARVFLLPAASHCSDMAPVTWVLWGW